MGLYSSFDPSIYYDNTLKRDNNVKSSNTTNSSTKPSVSVPANKVPPLNPAKKRSLYEQAKETLLKHEKLSVPDFREIYRVGQAVAIQGPNGQFRTRKGIIAEIVAKDLMYVYMTDTYKDANDQWLADFVTSSDKITPL